MGREEKGGVSVGGCLVCLQRERVCVLSAGKVTLCPSTSSPSSRSRSPPPLEHDSMVSPLPNLASSTYVRPQGVEEA